MNLFEEVKLHHDHLLLNVLVSLELIIDDVGVDGLGLVPDGVPHRYLSQKVNVASCDSIFIEKGGVVQHVE